MAYPASAGDSGRDWAVRRDGYLLSVDEWTALTGQSVDQMAGDGWMNVVHPDDAERARSAWQTAVAHQSPYNTDYRLRCADGIYRWFNARGIPILDLNGDAVQWVGVILAVPGVNRIGRPAPAVEGARDSEFHDLTPEALRAARAMLDWSAQDLADVAGLSLSTVRRLEANDAPDRARPSSIAKVIAALQREPLWFLGENGVISGVQQKLSPRREVTHDDLERGKP